jgi:hypothetical protein
VIGNEGWYSRKGERTQFDQQPIEAMALTEACAQAFRTTGDPTWIEEAQRCLAWFLGQNDLGIALYDFKTGGTHDGLMSHGVNENQGAESTLSWLIASLTMIELIGDEALFKGLEGVKT